MGVLKKGWKIRRLRKDKDPFNEKKKKSKGFLISIQKWISKYRLLLVISIPAFGAAYQVVMLWSIGFAYLRFFSSTQLINDGIIVAIVVILLYSVSYFVNRIARFINKKFEENHVETRKDFIIVIILKIFLMTAYLLTFIYLFLVYFLQFQRIQIKYDLLIILMIAIVYPIFYEKLYNNLRSYFDSYKSIRHQKTIFNQWITNWLGRKFYNSKTLIRDYFGRYLISILYIVIILICTLFQILRNTNLNDLKNLDKVERIVKKEYNVKVDRSQILYFNDNFVFVKYYSINKESNTLEGSKNDSKIKKEICIIPFQSLFEIKN